MMEFSILKIIDGILISDNSILQDLQFVYNNRISHIVGWIPLEVWKANPIKQQVDEEFFSFTTFLKDGQSTTPSCDQIFECVDMINKSKEQHLCCLIYSDAILDAIKLLAPYFIIKFNWCVDTIVKFFQIKLEKYYKDSQRSFSLAIEQSLIEFRNMSFYPKQAKAICWTKDSLYGFSTKNQQELLIVNTIKNMLIGADLSNESERGREKKKKRIQWIEDTSSKFAICNQIPQKLFVNSRISNSLRRGSSIKLKDYKVSLKVSNSELNLSLRQAQARMKQNLSKRSAYSYKQNQIQDVQYLSLKELSRTNFDQIKNRTNILQKRRSIKLMKSEAQISGGKKNIIKPEIVHDKDTYASNFIKGIKALSMIPNLYR